MCVYESLHIVKVTAMLSKTLKLWQRCDIMNYVFDTEWYTVFEKQGILLMKMKLGCSQTEINSMEYFCSIIKQKLLYGDLDVAWS